MLVVLGINHRSASVAQRERFAFAESAIPVALAALRSSGCAEEAVILSTCNRVELYVSTQLDEARALAGLNRFLLDFKSVTEPVEDGFYKHSEPTSVYHLFRVAAGLDSMVLGETEILGQLKKAYDLALANSFTGKVLNRAFQRAFNTAKYIRSHTQIQRGSISVSSVAVELAEKVFDDLSQRRVLVIGAGDTSEKAAKALLSRGAKHLVVTNRSPERAAALAATLGGTSVPWERWTVDCPDADISISSTSAPGYVIDQALVREYMTGRSGQPLLLVDIAVPRDIDPAINQLEGVYLYNIDDLQAIAEGYLKQRQEEIALCESIIQEKAQAVLSSLNPGAMRESPIQISPSPLKVRIQ